MPDHSDRLPGARLAAQRQHAAGRVAARHRRGRRTAGVLPVPADHQHVAAAAASGSPTSTDESILRLLDPLDEGKPDLAPAEIWRDYIRTVGRTPNGVWGGKLMWNQTPLLLQRAKDLPERSGDGLLVRDPRRRRLRSGARPRLPSRRGLAGGVVLARGADPGLARPARPGARRARRVPRRRDRPRRHDAARPGGGLAHLVRRGGRRTDRRARIRCCGATSPRSSAPCSRRWASIRGWRPRRCWNARPISAPTSGWSATAPTPNGRDCRYDGTSRTTTPRTSTNCGCWRPRPCTSSARSSPSCERPVLLFSAGKDSIVLLRLAEKAFRPSPLPFPVLHVDTGHNFDEVIEFRDRRVTEQGHKLIVGSVQESHRQRPGARSRARRVAQPPADPHAARRAGGRRLRRRVRRRPSRRGARPRQGTHPELPRRVRPVGSARPAARAVVAVQRPDHARANRSGCSRCRTGPSSTSGATSSWKTLSCRRSTSRTSARSSSATASCWRCRNTSQPAGRTRPSAVEWVRYRTVGDLTITGAVRSHATDIAGVIAEISAATVSERGETRADDRTSVAAMEDRKREGYF